MFGISLFELGIILIIILIIFKPNDLPLLIKNASKLFKQGKEILQEGKEIVNEVYSSLDEDAGGKAKTQSHNKPHQEELKQVEIIGDDGKRYTAYLPQDKLQNVSRETLDKKP